MRPLRRMLGSEKLLDSSEYLTLYSFDATTIRGEPVAVVMAESTDDVRDAINFARNERFTITARGAGTGLSGGSVPVHGGIVLSCERMNSILKIDVEDRIAIVQPGIVTSVLQEAAARQKLFYPPDPSSHTVSTIGGNVAENAGGLRCFKYGVTGHYVLGIEFLDAEGRIHRTGALSDGDAEPELTPLLVGSEGTLGIFTRIALRLIDAPEKTATLSAYFSDSAEAFDCVESIIRSGCVPSVIEYIDDKALSASAGHVGISCPDQAAALLLLEIDGSEEEVITELPKVQDLLRSSAIELDIATDETSRELLWQLRRGISPSMIRLSGGKIHEDVAVPRGRLSDLVRRIRNIEGNSSLEIPLYGHAGDGNLHVVILYDEADTGSVNAAREASREIFRSAIDLDGTITGEHGIGCAKLEYLAWQQSEAVLSLTRQVKQMLDPRNLFNPGKIIS